MTNKIAIAQLKILRWESFLKMFLSAWPKPAHAIAPGSVTTINIK